MGLSRKASVWLQTGISSLSHMLSLAISTGSFPQSINYRLNSIFILKIRNNLSLLQCCRTAGDHSCLYLYSLSPSYFLWLLQNKYTDHPQRRVPVALNAKANGHTSVFHITESLCSTWRCWPPPSTYFSNWLNCIISWFLPLWPPVVFFCWLLFLWPPDKPVILDFSSHHLWLEFGTKDGYRDEWGMKIVG